MTHAAVPLLLVSCQLPLQRIPLRTFRRTRIANEWLLSSVREIMLNQVLLKSKLLATFVANPFFVYLMDLHVPFQTIFCFKVAFAGKNITLKSLLSISVLSHFYFDVLNSYNN